MCEYDTLTAYHACSACVVRVLCMCAVHVCCACVLCMCACVCVRACACVCTCLGCAGEHACMDLSLFEVMKRADIHSIRPVNGQGHVKPSKFHDLGKNPGLPCLNREIWHGCPLC